MKNSTIYKKLDEFLKLGGASKQLATRKRFEKLSRRCHIAMAYIVGDIWCSRKHVFKVHPELKDLFEALMLLYLDCENDNAESYIKQGTKWK